MAEMRTLKNGRLYLLKDGSSFTDFAQAEASSGCLTSLPGGGWAAFVEESGDFFRYTGATPASMQAANPSASLTASGNVTKPVAYNDGSRLHLWCSTDEGSSVFDLRYAFSTNDGVSFSTPVDLNIVGDQTWCNDDIWPLYFEFEGGGANTHYLWCVGNNGGTYTLGRVTVATPTTFNAGVSSAGAYVAAASPVSTHNFNTSHIALTKHAGALWLYHTGSDVGDIMRVSRSADGAVWTAFEVDEVFRVGAFNTTDDHFLRPYAAVSYQGMIHLLYGGGDGDTVRAKLAVGENPEQLVKVPWMDVATFGSADQLVSYAADLTFTMPDQTVHVMKRNGPGALRDAAFEPAELSFTMRHLQLARASGDDDAYAWLAGMAGPEAGQDVNTDNALELGQLNVAYIIEDDDGSPAEYYLFPHCAVSSLQNAGGAEGNTITATLRCHNMRRPLFGSIE